MEDYLFNVKAAANRVVNQSMRRAAKRMLRVAMANTKQDSGQAAASWYFDINTDTPSHAFKELKGVSPVGKRGDRRGERDFRVMRVKLSEFEAAMDAILRYRGKINNILIYNPIPYDRYIENANIDIAAYEAGNQGVIDDIVREENNRIKF